MASVGLLDQEAWNTRSNKEQGGLLVHRGGKDPSNERLGVQVRNSETEREVQALLDEPSVGGQEGSGVVERVQERKRERHDQLISDLQEELSAISEKLQPAVKKAAEEFREKQDDSLQVMEAMLVKMCSSEELSGLTLRDVEGVWQGVESQLALRLRLIEEFYVQLTQVEEQRAGEVCECLHSYSGLLGGVAYCSVGELASLMEEKAHSLNLTSLANRRLAAQLCTELSVAERQVALQLRVRWEEKVAGWREVVLHNTLSRFKDCIGVSEGEGGSGEGGGVERGRKEVERVKSEMIAELSGLQHRKQELLTQLLSLAPPSVAVETLHRLRESSHDIQQQMESCLSRHLLALGQAWEQLTSACEAEMEVSKDALLLSGVCDSSTVYQVLTSDFLPLTERMIEEERAELHSIERSVESHLVQQQSWFQSVLQYGIGASQLWRDHSSALVKVKRSRGEALEQLRAEHDVRNQNQEANLDVVLDHMRQASNEEVLDHCLHEASELLKAIAEGYEEFHGAVLTEVEVWPAVMKRCVQEYDSALCQYLGAGREPPVASKVASKVSRRPPVASKKDRAKTRSVNLARAGSKPPKKTTPTSSTPKPCSASMATIVEEVIVATGVVKYYITPEVVDGQTDGSRVFLTQDEGSEEAPHVIASQALPLNKDSYQQARTRLRAIYLGHLERWREEVHSAEEREGREREEEALAELDLRRHLHRPRQSRITQDVHGVRAAELVAHRDRVSRHARAVVRAVADIKTRALAAPDAMKAQEEEYAREMESLEGELIEAAGSVGLQQLESKAKHLLEKRLLRVQSISTDLQRAAEEAIADLSTANTAFRQSLRLFSEAGNYCPEEVELFSHKLDRLAGKMSTTQSQVVADVTEACSERSLSAGHVFTHFHSIYQKHWTDVCYLEAVKRLLTNLQLSIRTVVADSNSQASKLHDEIARLRNAMECGDHTPILAGLPPLITLCAQRTGYLHCRATLQQGARVGGEGEEEREQAGRGQPISAVNITRSIRDHTGASAGGQRPAASSDNKPPQLPVKETGRKVGTQSRKKTTAAIVERKNVNFGLGGGGEGTSCFLPQIRELLCSCYADLYSTTEVYYRGKGLRPVTRPQSMASSCEEALDRLIDSCQTYRHQCEDYRNNAITEYRAQLDLLLSVLVGVAPLVLGATKGHHMMTWENERKSLQDSHHQAMERMAKEKSSHECALHPGLGHPAAAGQLEGLREGEQRRHDHLLEHIRQHSASVQTTVLGIGRELAAELVVETERLLTLSDTLPTTNEIIPGSTQHTQLPVDQLLRQQLRPPDEDKGDEGIPLSSSRGGHWPGVSAALLDKLAVDSEERRRLSGGVTTKKSSVAHSAVVRARDAALQEFVLCVEEVVLRGEERERDEREREGRWWDHWKHSLDTLAQLYSS